MLKIWRIHYIERIAKHHFRNNIHGHTLERRVQIHRQIFKRQFVEPHKELLDLALDVWGEFLDSFRREERV